MRIFLLFTFLFGLTNFLAGQNSNFLFEIKFKSKNDSLFDAASSDQFLTERAINRKSEKNIPIEIQDYFINQAYLDTLNDFGFNIKAKSKWFNLVVVEEEDSSIVDTLSSLNFIKSITYLGKKSSLKSTLDKFVDAEVQSSYGEASNQIEIMGGEFLHSNNFKGKGMLVSVTDAGFEGVNQMELFSYLIAQNRIVATKNFVNQNADVYQGHRHGTQVLSLMAGYLPNEFSGTAIEADYALLVSEDVSSETILEEYYWLSAAEYADSIGSDIINVSLGYKEFEDSTMNHTQSDLNGSTTLIAKAVNLASAKGMIVVVSAGNSGQNTENPYVGTPADALNAFTVGAIDQEGNYADLSSVGNNNFGPLKPNVVAVGKNTIIANTWTFSGVSSGNGTSFAAPLVSGMLACLWQSLPNVSNSTLMAWVQENSSNYIQHDTLIGYGIPNFSNVYIKKGTLNDSALVSVYPNPFIETITISHSSLKGIISVDLYNIEGDLVKKYNGCNKNRITIRPEITNGIYIFKITTSNSSELLKVIKN